MNKYYSEDYRVVAGQEVANETIIAGAGGGCFPAGTLVRTIHGAKPIERCMVGDAIVAYDRFGELGAAYIDAVHSHKRYTYQDDLYFIFADELSLFPNGITGNHAVFDIATNEHKEIQEFAIGDKLLTLEGAEVIITSISITANADLPEDCIVYNLTVYPQHTFLVGSETTWVRVHNGGGGKSGGTTTSTGAIEAPNTLQSYSIARVLDVISQGEIVGIFGGGDALRGTYFNNTPLKNSAGQLNFTGVTFDSRNGLPSQTVIPGFSDVESEVIMSPIHVQSGAPVIQYLPDSGKNAAIVTISLPDGLWETDTTNGNLNGYTVSYKVWVKDNTSATWLLAVDQTVRDKTTSPWEIAHRVSAPVGATQWGIKVERVTADDTVSSKKSTLYWQRLTEILDEVHTYPNCALVGMTIPAVAVGNSIPARGYDVTGVKLQVPSNYDPLTRTYGSTYWDGTFKTAWTDNTAWVLYDLITNTRYGIANFLSQNLSVDKWAFYEASLFNDCATWMGSHYVYNYIPDGIGGFEVRYSFNAVIATQSDAWQLLHAVASNMMCLLVMNGDRISIIQDRPKVVKKILNNTNVIDGMFAYSGTEVTSRATAVNVTFNDKYDRYLPHTITVEDAAYVTKFGYSTKDLAAYGCVTESQARRMAKWALYTELHQHDLVTFSLGLNVVNLQVGDVISIMDDNYISDNNEYLTGRVSSVNGNIVTLGNQVTLHPGHTYQFGVMSLDYTYIVEAVIVDSFVTPWTTDTITLNQTLDAGNYANHEFFCFSSGYIEPRPFTIQSITESAKGIYAVTGIFYDKDKWAYVEQGLVVIPPNYSQILSTQLPSVSTISFKEVFMNDGIASHNYIDVSWLWNEDHAVKDAVTYNAKWRRDHNNYTLVSDIPVKSFHIPDTTPGTYDVTIEAVNMQGKRSIAVSNSYAYRTTGGASSLIPPTGLYVLGTTGVIFTGTHIPIIWSYPAANNNVTDRLLDYQLEVWTPDGVTKLGTYIIQPNASDKGGIFDYTLAMNANNFTSPSRNVQIKVYSRDMTGNLSATPTIATFTNPAPTLTNWTVSPSFGAVFIKITPSVEDDIKEYIIYASATANFTKNAATIVYAGPDPYKNLSAASGTTMYYAVSIADTFGRAGSNISTEQSATAVAIDPDSYTYTGLKFKPNDPSTNMVTWEAATATRVTQAGVSTTWNITAETTGKTWTAGTMYIYYVPGDTTLTVGTSLVAAIAAGGRILATYKGGTDLTADSGRAFTSGDMVLAGTVGANALVTNTAVITNAAQIGNILESDGYSWTPGAYSGWRVDKTGYAQFTAVTIRDSFGNLLFSSGTGMEWNYVNGKPTTLAGINSTEGSKLSGIAAGADVTSANTAAAIAGQGSFATLNQLNSSNITTYMANAAIGAAQIGSIALVGTSNFSVKSGTGGARQEMDNQGTRIYDSAGTLRVKIGNLA